MDHTSIGSTWIQVAKVYAFSLSGRGSSGRCVDWISTHERRTVGKEAKHASGQGHSKEEFKNPTNTDSEKEPPTKVLQSADQSDTTDSTNDALC